MISQKQIFAEKRIKEISLTFYNEILDNGTKAFRDAILVKRYSRERDIEYIAQNFGLTKEWTQHVISKVKKIFRDPNQNKLYNTYQKKLDEILSDDFFAEIQDIDVLNFIWLFKGQNIRVMGNFIYNKEVNARRLSLINTQHYIKVNKLWMTFRSDKEKAKKLKIDKLKHHKGYYFKYMKYLLNIEVVVSGKNTVVFDDDLFNSIENNDRDKKHIKKIFKSNFRFIYSNNSFRYIEEKVSIDDSILGELDIF